MDLRRDIILIATRAFAALCVLLIVAMFVGENFNKWWNGAVTGPSTYQSLGGGACNIAVIPLQGGIEAYESLPGEYNYTTTSGDAVVAAIRQAEADSGIKGIVLQVDSTGGSPAASEQIMRALKSSPLPTVAYIRSAGDSGGYLAALGASTIIASNYADVGSIGITQSYLQQTKQDEKNGLEYVQLSSGKYKDTTNPSYPMTADQRALLQRDLDSLAKIFINQVAESRHMATSAVEKLADGASAPAALALKEGLIDQIGDEETVRAWFTHKLGDEATLCAPTSH
jgi:protease-4